MRIDRNRLGVAALCLAATALLLGASSGSPSPAPAGQIACADLATTHWGGFRVDSAEVQGAEGDSPAHCRVTGTIDSEIHFELLLPLPDAWNGRFVMGGGGGFVGTIDNQAMTLYANPATPLARGFATVATDTGHRGSAIDARWALDREDREVNFGFRAVHLTSEVAKTIIRLHYGRDIDYSYFLGCSRGGGYAMMESQRYPDDFDGIVGGAPAYDWTGVGTLFLQITQAMYPVPTAGAGPVVTPEARRLLSNAILEACDDLDGVADGILNDPRTCSFELDDLPRCTAGASGSACLTQAQLDAIKVVYRGAVVGGTVVYPGFPFGGEAEAGGWGQWTVGAANALGPGTPSLHYAFSTQFYKYMVFDDPEWSYADYDFSTWARDTRHIGELLNATDTDLTPFKVAGGKLILWNGWADPALTPLGTIKYYEGVQSRDPDVRRLRPAIPSAGRPALLRRTGPRSCGLALGDPTLGRGGTGARAPDRVEGGRQGQSDAAAPAVRVSGRSTVRRRRGREARRELHVRGRAIARQGRRPWKRSPGRSTRPLGRREFLRTAVAKVGVALGAFALGYLVDDLWARLVRGLHLERERYPKVVLGRYRVHHNVVGWVAVAVGVFWHPVLLIPFGLGMILGHRRRDRLFWFIERVG